uniref:TAFII55 protein conserved region domain-containing protein n=1 Tax=Oryza punctata TaxID=4537 RepID=A0A0E0JLS2_ORYPU
MEEQFILRVPPSVAERIERLMNEAAGASSSSTPTTPPLTSPSQDGTSGTFTIGNESFPASLLDLPTVMESYNTYDDSVLTKTADIGQKMILLQKEFEYTHGLTPPMRDARRRRFRREPDLNNASVIGAGEGGKKAAPAPATKPNVQRPAANGEEAEAERSDSDESVDP